MMALRTGASTDIHDHLVGKHRSIRHNCRLVRRCPHRILKHILLVRKLGIVASSRPGSGRSRQLEAAFLTQSRRDPELRCPVHGLQARRRPVRGLRDLLATPSVRKFEISFSRSRADKAVLQPSPPRLIGNSPKKKSAIRNRSFRRADGGVTGKWLIDASTRRRHGRVHRSLAIPRQPRMMDPKLPLPIDVMDDHCGPDESLIRGCEELRRELCACLGALLPVVSKQADAERRASIADANVNLRRGSKDDGSTIGASRARGGLKKQRSQGSDDFAVDDLSLTLAVASLLKSLYVALDSCGEDPLSRSEQNGSPSSASTAAPGTADAGRLVAAIVSRKEEALNLNDFLSLMADADVGHGDFAANQPSDAINAEATLAKAPMEPVRANIKQLDLKNMTPQQSAAWKDVDRGISLVLSIAAKRCVPL